MYLLFTCSQLQVLKTSILNFLSAGIKIQLNDIEIRTFSPNARSGKSMIHKQIFPIKKIFFKWILQQPNYGARPTATKIKIRRYLKRSSYCQLANPYHWLILILHGSSLSRKEIAEHLGITKGSVKHTITTDHTRPRKNIDWFEVLSQAQVEKLEQFICSSWKTRGMT